jgi:hypothetical protein
LKELALLALIYEEEICRLHSTCRRPHDCRGLEGPRANIDSNRVFWAHKDHSVNVDMLDEEYQDHDRGVEAFKRDISVPELRDLVISCIRKQALTALFHFPDTGSRNRLMNFPGVLDRGDEYPQTIEFRQARGTLNQEEIAMWVKFCIGLVQLAKFYAQNPDRFLVKTWEDKIDVFDLLRDMQLGEDAVLWWERRQAKYAHLEDEDARSDNEEEPSDAESPSEGAGDDDDEHGGGGDSGDDGGEDRPNSGGGAASEAPGSSGGGRGDDDGGSGDDYWNSLRTISSDSSQSVRSISGDPPEISEAVGSSRHDNNDNIDDDELSADEDYPFNRLRPFAGGNPHGTRLNHFYSDGLTQAQVNDIENRIHMEFPGKHTRLQTVAHSNESGSDIRGEESHPEHLNQLRAQYETAELAMIEWRRNEQSPSSILRYFTLLTK